MLHPRPRHLTVHGHADMATMDQGYRSVATSVCEVWRGEAEDWESPYASASDADYESDVKEPMGLLHMEDLPSRRPSSPHLLPPRGERRDFGFQAVTIPPPLHPCHPSPNMDEQVVGFPSGVYRHRVWSAPTRNGHFILNGPLLLTMGEDAMTEEDGVSDMLPSSRASRWSRGGALTGPIQPLRPLSRAVSPVFSARRTRDFLSPIPTRTARFDFGAWGCDRASRSSLRPVGLR